MKKRSALLIALCLILAILIFNTPSINYGHGAEDVHASADYNAFHDVYDDALVDRHTDRLTAAIADKQ
jgi:hypothetical protein